MIGLPLQLKARIVWHLHILALVFVYATSAAQRAACTFIDLSRLQREERYTSDSR